MPHRFPSTAAHGALRSSKPSHMAMMFRVERDVDHSKLSGFEHTIVLGGWECRGSSQ